MCLNSPLLSPIRPYRQLQCQQALQHHVSWKMLASESQAVAAAVRLLGQMTWHERSHLQVQPRGCKSVAGEERHVTHL